MGTKRIGRVGERDAGFHSNGALPSALSCCHYGSEVFRSCRKQSYGKTRLPWSISPAAPSPTPSVQPADVMWSEPRWCGFRQLISLSPSLYIVCVYVCVCAREITSQTHSVNIYLDWHTVRFIFQVHSFFSCHFLHIFFTFAPKHGLPLAPYWFQRNLFS